MKLRTALFVMLLGICADRSATAAPVDNPGNYVWDTGDATLSFKESSPFSRTPGAATGTWDMDVDGAGSITFNSMTIGTVSVSPYTVQIQVQPAGSSGTLDASTAGYNASLTLRIRVKVTGGSVGANCQTAYVNTAAEGSYIYYPNIPPIDPWGIMTIYTGSTGSGSGTWVALPAMTTGSCGGSESTVNTLLGLGAGGGLGAVKIDRLEAKVYFGPYGS